MTCSYKYLSIYRHILRISKKLVWVHGVLQGEKGRQNAFSFFFFFFFSTEVGTQGLTLTRQMLYHLSLTSSPFLLLLSFREGLMLSAWCQPLTEILLYTILIFMYASLLLYYLP
jgi:hypothetical protein